MEAAEMKGGLRYDWRDLRILRGIKATRKREAGKRKGGVPVHTPPWFIDNRDLSLIRARVRYGR